MKMSDAEIIKAVECCSKQSCEGCPYNDGTSKCLMETLPKDTLDFINRQQATINRLKAENKNCGVKIQNQREQLTCNEKIEILANQKLMLSQQRDNIFKKLEHYQNKVAEIIAEGVSPRIIIKGDKETINSIEDILKNRKNIDIKAIKSEAYKEFAERLKAMKFTEDTISADEVVFVEDIDNLLQEMGCGE